MAANCLLIAPEGIEIDNGSILWRLNILLIAPEGIEIVFRQTIY